MYMRILYVMAAIVTHTSGTIGPSVSGCAISMRKRQQTGRDSSRAQRKGIVRSMLIANPTWNAAEALKAVQPAITAAGLQPVTQRYLSDQLTNIRKELRMSANWGEMSREHSQFLKDLFTQDPKQTPSAVLAKFRTAWGPDAETDKRITRRWRNMYYSSPDRKRPSVKKVAAASSTSTSPAAEDSEEDPGLLPLDWWDLGEEFDKLVSPESTMTPAMRRDRYKIVRSVAVGHPQWTTAQVSAAVTPLAQAAGLVTPIRPAYIRKHITRVRKELKLPETRRQTRPEHGTFLKAQLAENHKQNVSEVIVKFRTKFGPNAWKDSLVSAWWYNATHQLYHRPVSRAARVSHSTT